MNKENKSSAELLTEFIEESDKKLIRIREDFEKLKTDPGNINLINNLLRVYHNLKSSAFSLQLPNIRRISHLSEDILVLLRDKIVVFDERVSKLIAETINYLDETLINLYEKGFEGRHSPVDLILKLKEFKDESLGITSYEGADDLESEK